MEQKQFNNLLIFVAIFAIMLVTMYSKWLEYKRKQSKASEKSQSEYSLNEKAVGNAYMRPLQKKKEIDNKESAFTVSGNKIASSIDTSHQTGKDCVWSLTIGPISEGRHSYLFLIDGKMINDEDNSNIVVSEKGNVYSIFDMTDSKSKFPQIDLEKKIVTFIYYGEIKNNARVMGDFNNWEWSVDEFKPVNDKARELYNEILADNSLGKIDGRVVDSKGNPIRLALVMLKPLSEKNLGSKTTKSSEDGSFQINNIYPSDYVIIAKAKEFIISSPKMIKVSKGEKIGDITIELKSEAKTQ